MKMTITSFSALTPPSLDAPLLWGLDPVQLHDRYWAAQGVQVVRPDDPELIPSAGRFLLVDSSTLTHFDLARSLPRAALQRAETLLIRLRDSRRDRYKEVIHTDMDSRFLRLRRLYSDGEARGTRVVLTHDPAVARLWRDALDDSQVKRLIRRLIASDKRRRFRLQAPIYERTLGEDLKHLTYDLMRAWENPGAAIAGIHQAAPGVWCDRDMRIEHGAIFVSPVWIGKGRLIEAKAVAAGPAVLWDAEPEPDQQPVPRDIHGSYEQAWARTTGLRNLPGKRLFDILFSLFVLALTVPFYPFIMLAICIEDGWPVLFAHRRETRGGREFPCLKFRSMRRDAETIKASLRSSNRADGPQFFIKNDPRLTRIGRFLRDTNIDELPQFWNVLFGHMSVVGPRPSPWKENQYCPSWREARLSVRPGIVGLWQVCRSRAPGLDFQEWIRYDVEYARSQSWRLDLWIIWRSILLLGLRRKPRVAPQPGAGRPGPG